MKKIDFIFPSLIIMKKSLLIRSIVITSLSGFLLSGILAPKTINADTEAKVFIEDGSSKFCKAKRISPEVAKTIKMVITAYSSTPEETDSTPFITASGKQVRDGIIANNMLIFGTKVRIPQLYGDKIFTVEDRMHQRKGKYQVDIWFPEHKQAKEFGAKLLDIEILEG